ncbi:uncharacterized protein EV420DRAFT_1644897 [Desarmillaria tabescens]|uniref:HMG box domain-containing protein n=1 Tax=Armillaria tabescens TaxID=1929756 RepID=A0AA39K638_ARMTA|nr:uncharacterized protein EV420DRAFT_1644897 [Desarmillaria tabescens]KAK0455257.1 hypothetical protein EV420DRAFT_1644897 [Desarmillaria tabescens]
MTTRRSWRLSSQVPVRYDGEGWEATDLLMYLTTPVSEAPSPTPSTDSHSTIQSDTPSPRRHTPLHRRAPGHVPRPPNAFMIFRSHYWRDNKDTIRERNHREISRTCGELWKALPPAEKQVYRDMASSAKKEHLAKYPGYKFTPVSRRKKTRKTTSQSRDTMEEVSRCEKIATLIGGGIDGMELEKTMESDTCKTPSSSATADEEQISTTVFQFLTPQDQGEFICGEEDDFVPTCDISPFDLDAPNLEMYSNPPQLPNYSRVDSQFGFKSDIDINSCFWFTAAGENVELSPLTASTTDFTQGSSTYDAYHSFDSLDVLDVNLSASISLVDDWASI